MTLKKQNSNQKGKVLNLIINSVFICKKFLPV